MAVLWPTSWHAAAYQVVQVIDALLVGVPCPVVVGVRQVPGVARRLVQPGGGPGEVVPVACAVVPVHHATVERLHGRISARKWIQSEVKSTISGPWGVLRKEPAISNAAGIYAYIPPQRKLPAMMRGEAKRTSSGDRQEGVTGSGRTTVGSGGAHAYMKLAEYLHETHATLLRSSVVRRAVRVLEIGPWKLTTRHCKVGWSQHTLGSCPACAPRRSWQGAWRGYQDHQGEGLTSLGAGCLRRTG